MRQYTVCIYLVISIIVISVVVAQMRPFQYTITPKNTLHTTQNRALLSRSNTGNTFRIHRILNKKGPLKVLVLGGSLTAGADVGGKKHAWPKFLAVQSDDGLPDMHIENRAKGATGSNYALSNLDKLIKPYDWDLVLLEYALNDDSVGEWNSRYSSGTEVTKTFEHLIRNIRKAIPAAGLVIIEGFRQSKKPRIGFTSGQNYHDIISKYYELQVISIREAVWHDYFEDVYIRKVKSAVVKSFPIGKSHPNVDGQHLIANLVRNEFKRFQTDPPTHNRDRLQMFPPIMLSDVEAKQHPIISHWLHNYDFENEKTSKKGIIDIAGWDYVIQKSKSGLNKPGLLCKKVFPNYVDVTIDKCSRLIQIGYLKSYRSFGKAIVTIGTRKISLESRWDQSQGSGTFTDEFELEKPNVKMRVQLEKSEDKDRQMFKLLYIKCL